MIEHFKAQKLIHKRFAFQILTQACNSRSAPMIYYISCTCCLRAGNSPEGLWLASDTVDQTFPELPNKHAPTPSIGLAFSAQPSTPPFLQARDTLAKLPTLVDVSIPDDKHITVCGDTHGQFYDLCNIFELNGLPSEDNPYLFNGAQHGLILIVSLHPLTAPNLFFDDSGARSQDQACASAGIPVEGRRVAHLCGGALCCGSSCHALHQAQERPVIVQAILSTEGHSHWRSS